MKRPIAHALFLFAMFLGVPTEAQDFQCRNAAGCVARRPVNGTLQSVNFRKGDLVSTDDGWIVDPDDGWKKVRSKGTTGSSDT